MDSDRAKTPGCLSRGMMIVAVCGIVVSSFAMGWIAARTAVPGDLKFFDAGQLGVETVMGRIPRLFDEKENAPPAAKGLAPMKAGRANTTVPVCLSRAFALLCQYSRSKNKDLDFEECLRSPKLVWNRLLLQAQAAPAGAKAKASAHWAFLKRAAAMKNRWPAVVLASVVLARSLVSSGGASPHAARGEAIPTGKITGKSKQSRE